MLSVVGGAWGSRTDKPARRHRVFSTSKRIRPTSSGPETHPFVMHCGHIGHIRESKCT